MYEDLGNFHTPIYRFNRYLCLCLISLSVSVRRRSRGTGKEKVGEHCKKAGDKEGLERPCDVIDISHHLWETVESLGAWWMRADPGVWSELTPKTQRGKK